MDRYDWDGDWASFPEMPGRPGWAHHGVAVLDDDRVVLAHPADARILVYLPDGTLDRAFKLDIHEAHGITADGNALWIADIGCKADPAANYADGPLHPGRVLKVSLEGEILLVLPTPDRPEYGTGRYMPTSVSVNRANGDVWVADGYGMNLVHRFDRSGRPLSTLDGFSCPHAVFVDRGRVLVADRSNRRIRVFDAEGEPLKTFGEDVLLSPSNFCKIGDRLVVGELHARLAVFDRQDRHLGFLGENPPICATEGWPNRKRADGALERIGGLEKGRFNAPHGLAADSKGNLYVSEWMIGGRLTRLSRIPA